MLNIKNIAIAACSIILLFNTIAIINITMTDQNYYINRIKEVDSLERLYLLREELREEKALAIKAWHNEGVPANSANLNIIDNLNFYIKRVETQIEVIEAQGISITKIFRKKK